MPRMLLTICYFILSGLVYAQTGNALLDAVLKKLDKVDDYTARGKLKTNVVFIKAPVADIRVYFKKPDKMKIVNESGISFIPRGSVNINLTRFLDRNGNYDVIDAGMEPGSGLRILKLLPRDENSDIVLSVLYIDEKQLLVKKARNTSRDSGTYELELFYGSQAFFALPDKVIFSFNVKEYKLPRGVTMDYESGSGDSEKNLLQNKKGRVEITYSSYSVNKGVDDNLFD